VSEDKKVVFLKFSNENIDQDRRDWMACAKCQNKTYLVVYEGHEQFPLLQCAACSNHIGHFGWAHNEPGTAV
jgi:hypothetical protein